MTPDRTRPTTADRCHLCGHGFHGLPCRHPRCYCASAWVEPDDEGNVA